nr:uncharacterized protein LOC121125630 isoform X2 [Lepeophtheirus salmonis]
MSKEDKESLEDIHFLSQNLFAGVEEDIHTLLNRVNNAFDEYEELRFSHFVEIWKEMKFEYIFRGRETFRETYELTMGILRMVKDKILSPDVNLGYRAAAIYSLYALYFKQPPMINVHIRLTLSDVKEIMAVFHHFHEGQHWDIIYCWNRLMSANAFHFSGASRLMGIEAINSFFINKDPSSDYVPFTNPFKSHEFKSQLSELSSLQSQYISMKKSLMSEKQDPSLSLLDEEFATKMCSIVESAFSYESKDTLRKSEEIGDRRKKIIDKYFSNTGGSYRQKEIEV